ncbi:uncharacterized protein LOC142219865 [Haematobia irritans]|uniref:uncharacterized protein LOC142219865 n=1 Tax=Haematobia irritans TaxID=7368 RepID=UPI003F4F467B
MTEIRPFLCENIEKSLLRAEWERWLRSLTLYLQSEDIVDVVKKRNKLLHLGGPQLQEVVYNLPGAIEEYDAEKKNDVFMTLVEKLNEYFSPRRNSTFERHLFRNLIPMEGEDFNQFLLRLRHQSSKCDFGSTVQEIKDISIKDKIIDAWAPIDLKKKLLEKEQSLEDVIAACQIHEQIGKQSQTMTSKGECETVNRVVAKLEWPKRVNDECGRCGNKGHIGNDLNCPARNLRCNKCGLLGHFARKCKTKGIKRKGEIYNEPSSKQRRYTTSRARCIEQNECKEEDGRKYDCFKIDDNSSMDEVIECRVGGCKLSMIIDSGSRFNLLSQEDWQRLQDYEAVLLNVRRESVNQFKAYAADQLLEVVSVFEAPTSVKNSSEIMATFYVIKNGNQSLLGRDTAIQLKVLKLGLDTNSTGNKSETPFPKMKNVSIKLAIDRNVRPIQQPLRRIPVALEERVEHKLEEALKRDIIEEVSGLSSWISPIVPVLKGDGDIRLCVDMRRANKAVLRENYPLPTFEVFMTKLRGAKLFSRLDLKWAYHQLELHESSRDITTFITHKGLFRYKRLMFGISSAPEIFQRIMEELLSPCKKALNYIDDIIIFGNNEK